MSYLLCYTKTGTDKYRDLNDSMHLALSCDGTSYTALRNNTGVLFPEADMNDGTLAGCTKTLLYPWLFRMEDGSAGVIAVRRNNENKPDSKNLGCAILYQTKDFVRYQFVGFLPLASSEVKNTRCKWDASKKAYRVEWECAEGIFGGYTTDFKAINDTASCTFSENPSDCKGIADAIPGNVLEISDAEAKYIDTMLGVVYNTSVKDIAMEVPVGGKIDYDNLPKITCVYSDGSEHDMAVKWDKTALKSINTSKPGEYIVSGGVDQKIYPTPFLTQTSDPCIFHYGDKYYFTSSGGKCVIRAADTLDGLRDAEPIIIYEHPEDSKYSGFWAQELQIVDGVPYFFTSMTEGGKWHTVQSVILRCNGDICNPDDWSEPVFCRRKDGSRLYDKGVTLDMTYFCIDDVHYVSWSQRDIDPNSDGGNEYSTNGSADIYIATIDPKDPTILITDPVCLCRANYGWDRIEAPVDEGPFLLRHGDDLFLSISGSSVGVLYCVGLLHAKYGSDLLDPKSWDKVPYPLVTKESFPNQYGPGHNNFVKASDGSGDDLIVMLYRPLPEDERVGFSGDKNPRCSTIRRVHWGASGYPIMEMTPEQELNPDFRVAIMKVIVK